MSHSEGNPFAQRPSSIVSLKEIMRQVNKPYDPDVHKEIYEMWKTHSIAEDAHDIAGLLSTLTDDCVYELVSTGDIWKGHAGAEKFYTELLGAFPDIKFHLTDIVIGPQGVWEEALVLGTRTGPWLHYPADGQTVEFKVSIFFPWDDEAKKFRGETMYYSMGEKP